MSRKRLVSAMLGALAATAFIAPAAQADPHPDDTFGVAACVLAGLSGNAAVDSVEKDLALNPAPAPNDNGAQGWLLDTDSGNFTFGGTATCAAVDIASKTPYTANGGWAVGVGNAFLIKAGGTYNNLICGTGTANGTANITGLSNIIALGNLHEPPGTDIDASFGITFAAGVGALSLVVSPGADGSGPANGDPNEVGPNNVTGGNGAGVIDILPTTGSCVQGEGVTSFTVNGAFATSISGDGGFGG